MAARILIVAGSMRLRSRTRQLCEIAEEAVREAGGEPRLLVLRELDLPMLEMENPDQAKRPEVTEAKELARWAQGFILGTPEYHGGTSGLLKNWLDYLYHELAGKLAGVVTVSGGDFGGDMSSTATSTSFNWCHGFALPYSASARRGDFHELELVNAHVRRRIGMMAHDLVRYAPLLHDAFEDARDLGASVEAGMAGLHSDK